MKYGAQFIINLIDYKKKKITKINTEPGQP